MAITTVYTYPLDGSSRSFNVPFEYLARRFVVLTLIGVDRKELKLIEDFRFVSKTVVQTNKAWGPADGYTSIEVRRNTSATDRIVDFTDGSILRASDLNASQIQTLHVAEEARNMVADTISVNNDGDLDARGRRIVNVADGLRDGDAVNLRQMKSFDGSALNSAKQAATSATNAKTSETNAKGSETRAKASEDNAKGSETRAKASEDNAKSWATYMGGSLAGGLYSAQWHATEAGKSASAAKVSEGAAKASQTASKASEDNAKASELRAIEEASKLGNANAFMGTIENVNATGVSWKKDVILYARGFQAFHPTDTTQPQCLHDYNGLYRQAPVRIMATTGNVDITASTGVARLLAGASGGGISVSGSNIVLNTPGDGWYTGVQGTKPLFRLMTASKQCAYVAAYGDGNATLAVYAADGSAARGLTINYPNATMTWNGGLVLVGSVTGVVNLTASGTIQAAAFKGNGAALTNVPASLTSVFDALTKSTGGDRGCYSFMRNKSSTNFGLNGVTSGANLQYSSHNSQGTAVPPGSWRCMSQGNSGSASVWLRYA